MAERKRTTDPRTAPVQQAEEAIQRQQQMVTLGRLVRERLAPLEGPDEPRELTEAVQLLKALQESIDHHLEELEQLQEVIACLPVAA